MSNKNRPRFCPYCGGEDELDYIGQVSDGSYVVSCGDCETEILVRDVTGKVHVEVKVATE